MAHLILSFRQDLQINKNDDITYIQGPANGLTAKKLSGGIQQAMRMLAFGGGSEDDLCEMIIQEDGGNATAEFYYYLNEFIKRGFITYSVMIDQEILAMYIPFPPARPLNNNQFGKEQYRVSRFAYSRREGCQTVLESPLANGRIVLRHWLASAVVHLLSEASSSDEIKNKFPSLSEQSLEQFLSLLLNAGMLEQVDDNKQTCEDKDIALQQWEFHDLLFHTHSRMGRHDQPIGETFRFMNKISPLPAVKAPMSVHRIKLYQPDMEELRENDYTFSLVLEERKSIRDYADDSITVKQLGEFLYRSARIKAVHKANPSAGLLYDVSHRPYPGGGAVYELELYLCVNECAGLKSGLYHYDPMHHELEYLSVSSVEVERILKLCSAAAGLKDLAPVSIHITARFQRTAWKYQSIAYSLILKNVGVLYQTMYLVATAMDLAPSAIGSGDADLLCQAAGLDYLEESAVGEFILGSKRI